MLAHEAESQIIYEADWSYKQIKSVYMHVWICLCVTELLKTNKKAASKKRGLFEQFETPFQEFHSTLNIIRMLYVLILPNQISMKRCVAWYIRN